jgi:predicted ribosomally synthesized peptide with SipW-like signal peptide
MKKPVIKIAAILLIVGLNWAGLSAVIETTAYLNDTETSSGNSYTAGTLDFSINSTNDFIPETIIPLQQSTRTITVTNNGSLGFQYKITAGNFNGELCGALQVMADIDGGTPEYEGPLASLDTGAQIFSEPDEWTFISSLSTDGSADFLENESCNFKFIFDGWQESLSFGQGYSDREEISNNISAGEWMPSLLTPLDNAVINGNFVKQCWTPITGAAKYVYQSCNNDPDASGSCSQRWYAEYSPGSAEFDNACKSASGVGNANYWWHIAVVFESGSDSYTTSYTDAWKITIDNSHLNQVVINEFLPNPSGNDNAPMPNGEWVELYNNKGEDVDVADWWLYDSNDTNELAITSANTNTGGTLIKSGGFLVVYRDGDEDFALNNIGGDTVRLYNGEIGGGGTLIDSYTYTINAPEGKSFARIPNGSNTWVDPIPTPGEENVLEGEEIVFGPAEPEEGEDGYGEEQSITDQVVVANPESGDAGIIIEEVEEEPEQGIIDKINETIDEIVGGIVEEILPDETSTTEESIVLENPPVEEETVFEEPAVEEQPAEGPAVEEQPVIEDTPVNNEQEVILPDNNSSDQSALANDDSSGGDNGSTSNGDNSGNSGGDSGGTSTGEALTSSGDSGVAIVAGE